MEQEIFSVTKLTKRIKEQLEHNFRNIMVEGEISNLRKPGYGNHLYFTLKDESALIKGVIFSSILRNIRYELKDGMKIIARADLNVYDKRGEYQLIVKSVYPTGIGSLKMRFEQLKKKLEAEGLFDERYKKQIPSLPKRIGVVTAITGAAIKDVISVIQRRFLNISVIIRSVKVQGTAAAGEIAQAIEDFNEYGNVDVLIVGRGGGSFEDLFPFNEEVVARAIFDSRIPIISAVGHERDYSIADFVSDLRAATPSAAAELVIKNKDDLRNTLNYLGDSLRKRIREIIHDRQNIAARFSERFLDFIPQQFFTKYKINLIHISQSLSESLNISLNLSKSRIHGLQLRIINSSPVLKMNEMLGSIRHFDTLIKNRIHLMILGKNEELSLLTGKIDAYSPLKTLSRGYSITYDNNGEVLRNASRVKEGTDIVTVLETGRLFSKVTGSSGAEGLKQG